MTTRTKWFVRALGLACILYGFFGCQQPFGFAPGQKHICPDGYHSVFVKDGWRCVQDTTGTTP